MRVGDSDGAVVGEAPPGGTATRFRNGGQRPSATPGCESAERGGPADKAGPSGDHCPEQQLWCAVIVHTLYEATGRIGYAERGERHSVREAAIAWFEEAGADFQSVCDLAGLIPSAVRDGALRAIRTGRLPRIRIAKSGRGPAKAAGPDLTPLARVELPIASAPAEARC